MEISLFGHIETEYLGLWISKYRVRYLLSKVQAIEAIDEPTKVNDIRKFLGIVNSYREM